jgi:hypothetical protein
MLSFEPKYHTRIAEGQLVGYWIPMTEPCPSASFFAKEVRTSLFSDAQMHESIKIQQEGGSIVVFDPKGDSELSAKLHEITKELGRSDPKLKSAK